MTKDKKFHRACVVCGQEFQTNRTVQVCCCMKCSLARAGCKNRDAYHHNKAQDRICKICGKTYVGSDLSGICSSACRAESYRRVEAANRARQAMPCPWAAGTISEDLRGVSPAWGF